MSFRIGVILELAKERRTRMWVMRMARVLFGHCSNDEGHGSNGLFYDLETATAQHQIRRNFPEQGDCSGLEQAFPLDGVLTEGLAWCEGGNCDKDEGAMVIHNPHWMEGATKSFPTTNSRNFGRIARDIASDMVATCRGLGGHTAAPHV